MLLFDSIARICVDNIIGTSTSNTNTTTTTAMATVGESNNSYVQ
jgi:hypothetical protein